LPPLFNNNVIAHQKKARISFRVLDFSILHYADDILNLSITVSVEDTFSLLSREDAKIGKNVNVSKNELQN